jgi:hypothetical protein
LLVDWKHDDVGDRIKGVEASVSARDVLRGQDARPSWTALPLGFAP